MKTVFCFLFSYILNTAVALSAVPFEAELPRYLVKLGLLAPKLDSDVTGVVERNPILFYDLSDEKVGRMTAQYQAGEDAERKGRNDIALKVFWELAESGYGPANLKLSEAFAEGKLGLKKNHALASLFCHRPFTVEEMRAQQRSILFSLKWQKQNAASPTSPPGGDVSPEEVDLDVKTQEGLKLLDAEGLRRRVGK